MTPLDLALTALIVLGGAVVQTLVGFGMGMFSIPLLLFVGQSLPEAVALSVGAGFVQLLIGLRSVHRQVVWGEALGLGIVMGLAVPVGIFVMELLSEAGPARVKQGVGWVIFAALATRQLVRPVPRERVPRAWGVLAATCAGLLEGLVGMGGPPLVLYALAHRWSIERYRAFLWSQLALSVPVVVLAMGARFGWGILGPFALGLALTPCLWVGAHFGLRISRRWDARTLHRVVLGLLYALAIASALEPLRVR